MIVPPPLRPGDPIAVVAPSSPFDRALCLRGIAWLGERYRVRRRPDLFARAGYLAGSDARRAAELDEALASDARAVVAARGGYGAPRLVASVDWGRLARSPKWLVGFSDVTALHVEAAAFGVASVHGAMVCGLGRGDAQGRARWVATLEAPLAERRWTGLEAWAPGRARGRLFGGNLTLLHAAAAAGRLRLPDATVLVLEDVGERPYRIDRALTTLVAGGHLRSAVAVAVGGFDECRAGPDGTTIEAVLRERLAPLGVPVVAGLPIGHGVRNDPLVLGAPAAVDAAAGALVVGVSSSA